MTKPRPMTQLLDALVHTRTQIVEYETERARRLTQLFILLGQAEELARPFALTLDDEAYDESRLTAVIDEAACQEVEHFDTERIGALMDEFGLKINYDEEDV